MQQCHEQQTAVVGLLACEAVCGSRNMMYTWRNRKFKKHKLLLQRKRKAVFDEVEQLKQRKK